VSAFVCGACGLAPVVAALDLADDDVFFFCAACAADHDQAAAWDAADGSPGGLQLTVPCSSLGLPLAAPGSEMGRCVVHGPWAVEDGPDCPACFAAPDDDHCEFCGGLLLHAQGADTLDAARCSCPDCDLGGHGTDLGASPATGWAFVAHDGPRGDGQVHPYLSCAVCAEEAGAVAFSPGLTLPDRVELPSGDALTRTTVGYLLWGRFGGVSPDEDALSGAAWLAHRVDVELSAARLFLPGGELAAEDDALDGVLSHVEAAQQEAEALEGLLSALAAQEEDDV